MILASDVKPAGGAELGEVLVASALGGALAAALLLVVYLHRSGRTTLVQRAADGVGRTMGAPAWVALPTVFTTISLLTALTGMYWDISLHIGQGRDSGPLANPAHYLILFGLFGIFAGGVLAISLPVGFKPGPASVRITEDWHAPVGGLLLAGAGMYALLGFPLDDVWHRLFGQDVTLWGPTHLMLIGGAGLSLVGLLVLEKEGGSEETSHGAVRDFLRKAFATGGLLIGLSVFQGEFDFGVPQFRLVLQPALIAVAAGVALVAARLWIGKGGALAAAAFFLFVHGAISIAVGFGWDEVTPRFPLYVGSALLVEALAALMGTRRPVLFGAVAGAVVGTLGTATELLWSKAFLPLPWGSDMVVEGTLMALVCGVAGGVVGAMLALGLQSRLAEVRRAPALYLASLLAVALVVTNGLIATVPRNADVDVALTEAGERGGIRYVDAEVTLPQGLVDDPSWVQVTAWQGDGLVLAELEQTTEGTWRTTEPFPASGSDWKTLLRIHDGRTLTALPVWLPADAALDAEEVPAPARFTRTLGPEIEILQRERNLGVPAWLFGAASLVVLACSLALVAALAWGVARVSRGGGRPRRPGSSPAPARALKPQPAS